MPLGKLRIGRGYKNHYFSKKFKNSSITKASVVASGKLEFVMAKHPRHCATGSDFNYAAFLKALPSISESTKDKEQ